MELFTKDDKLIYVIEKNHQLLPVLNRFGIRLGFGDVTIAEICEVKNIDVAFFLDVINAFHNPDYFMDTDYLNVSPVRIVDYLQKTHSYYLNWVLPRLEEQLENLIRSGSPNDEHLKLLRIFFRKCKSELLVHFQDEEATIFPYSIRIYNVHKGKAQLTADDLHKAITNYEKEHTELDEKLNDLKGLIIKFLKADYDDNLCNEFLQNLLRFERDLIDHSRIEDKILVPVVARIEKLVKNGE